MSLPTLFKRKEIQENQYQHSKAKIPLQRI